jgi:hypothetical protein
MLVHPNDEELALYAEHGSAAPNASSIETHLRGCRECLALVSEVRNLRDLDIEGLLPSTPYRPGRHLAAYLNNSKKPRVDKTALGGVGLLAGLFSSGLAAAKSGTPAFSFGHSTHESHHENEDVGERSRTEDDSHPVSRYLQETEREHFDMSPITRPDPIIGTPEPDSHHFPGQQQYSDTCAIRCQEFIIRQYTGTHLPESYYVQEATANHWYHDGSGTSMENVGKLLELHNIPVNRYAQADMLHLTAELAKGHKVIIGVQADDLWRQHPIVTEIRHLLGFSAADHAVVVSGIDTSDPNHYKVIVSDPGTGQAAVQYPMEQFIQAWKESHYFMVATQDPPPESMHLPEMKNFDYHSGHIDHIGDMSYDSFHVLLEDHRVAATPSAAHHYEEQFGHHLHPAASEPTSHDVPGDHDHVPSAHGHEPETDFLTHEDASHRQHGEPPGWDSHHHHIDNVGQSHDEWQHGISDDHELQDPDSGDDHDT